MVTLRDLSSKYDDVFIISSVFAGLMLYLLVRKTTKRIGTTLAAVEINNG